MKRCASALRLAIVVATLSLSACGSFGGVCDPTVDYPRNDPCHRDPPDHSSYRGTQDRHDEQFK